MKILSFSTLVLIAVSFILDPKKTREGVLKGLRMFIHILPALFNVLILVSLFLFIVPEKLLTLWLGRRSGWLGVLTAALLGSISLIPGFIAFPLAAILVRNGVAYPVIAVFITTLMMVGIFTLPLESRYFGWKVAVLRNGLSLLAALCVGLLMGAFL